MAASLLALCALTMAPRAQAADADLALSETVIDHPDSDPPFLGSGARALEFATFEV